MDKTAWEASLHVLSITERAIQINRVKAMIPKKTRALNNKKWFNKFKKQSFTHQLTSVVFGI